MARVRVVVPTYNRAALLDEALTTVFAQSAQDFEVIVSDDGSTDGTRDVLASWQRRDRRLCVLDTGHHGVAAARNRAMAAPGEFEFIAFLDSDDLWTEHHLKAALDVFDQHADISLVFGMFDTVDLSGLWTSEMIEARNDRVQRPKQLSDASLAASALRLDRQKLRKALL